MADAEECSPSSTYNGSLGLRIGGLFIILAVSRRFAGFGTLLAVPEGCRI